MQSNPTKINTIEQAPIDGIVRRDQVRKAFPVQRIAGMAQSIRRHGVLLPLLAHRESGVIVLDDGELRLRAAELAGLKTVPVIINDEPIVASDVIQRQLVANCQRVDLTPLEKANAINELIRETKWTAAEVAQSLGISPAQVSKMLALLLLPANVQQQVAAGKLAPSVAYEIAKIPDAADRARIAGEAASGNLTRDGVIGQAKALAKGSKRKACRQRHKSRVVFPLDGNGSVTVTAREISIGALVDWIGSLFASLTAANASGLALSEFIASFSSKRQGC